MFPSVLLVPYDGQLSLLVVVIDRQYLLLWTAAFPGELLSEYTGSMEGGIQMKPHQVEYTMYDIGMK